MGSLRGRMRGRAAGLAGIAVVVGLLGAGPAPAASATTAETAALSDQAPTAVEDATALPDGRYFGAELDWSTDNVEAYAERAGVTPSYFSRPFAYPLEENLQSDLLETARQVAQLGSLAVITLEPSKPLEELTEADAAELVEVLQRAEDEYGTAFYLRFAPEMNGTWYEWGQKPDEYVAAFRLLADAVHAGAPSAAMLWAPSYAAGYPFTEAYGAVDELDQGTVRALDTNGNELVDVGDDPYSPYYPGDDAVDWVGLTMYHYGSYQPGRVAENRDEREYSGAIITSVLPEEDKFATQLAGTYGLPSGAPAIDFAKEYAAGRDQRFFIQTAALYDPEDPDSADEADIKAAWLDQLFDPAIAEEYPEIGMITWLEDVRPEPEAEGRTVNWRITASGAIAALLEDALATAPELQLAPVVEPHAGPDGDDQQAARASAATVTTPGTLTIVMGVVCAVALGWVVVWLLRMAVRPSKPRG